ncbi:uncharacterized protein CLUP02_01499, partial [Colletotrichum lupini]
SSVCRLSLRIPGLLSSKKTRNFLKLHTLPPRVPKGQHDNHHCNAVTTWSWSQLELLLLVPPFPHQTASQRTASEMHHGSLTGRLPRSPGGTPSPVPRGQSPSLRPISSPTRF